MRLNTRGFTLAVAVGLAVSTLGATAANAEVTEYSDAAAVLTDILPESLATASPLSVSEGELTAETSGATVTIPSDKIAPIQLNSGGAEIFIGIDAAASAAVLSATGNAASFAHADGDASVANINEDGSLRITSVLQTPDSPDSFSYTYTGVDLVLFEDGGVVGYDENGAVQLLVELPWAFDAKGTPVPTWYELEGNVLTQVVDHSSATLQYPIAADPTNYGGNTMYKNISAAVDPEGGDKVSATVGTYNFSRASDSAIWESYKSLVPAKYEAETMRKQLICHARNIGAVKNPWNLETRRPNVSYANFVLNLCNPN